MTRRRPDCFSTLARTGALTLLLMLTAINAHTAEPDRIKVGRTTDLSLFYLPSYIAMDTGIFREEGLETIFVVLDDRELTAAGVSGMVDFAPDVGGVEAAIKGAPVRFIVGQSQISPWVIVADPGAVKSVKGLKGLTLGFGKPGNANSEEASFVLRQFFGMAQGGDYKTVSIAGEPDRLAALVGGKIQGALVSFPVAAKAGIEGFDIVLKSGHYVPRLQGAYWVTASYLEKNHDIVRRFIRAIAKATLYLATNQIGSLEIIQKRFGIKSPAEANVLWNAVHREFDPNIPDNLLGQIFAQNLDDLRRKGLWPRSRPMPALGQFIARDILKSALGEIGY